MTERPELVCVGRPVDDSFTPTGKPCKRTFRGQRVFDGPGELSGTVIVYREHRYPTDAELRDQARGAGWSVAGPPMCPRCRKPDPAIARGLQPSGKDT